MEQQVALLQTDSHLTPF